MPQLRSGRHVAFSASAYLDALASESDESKHFACVALRLHATTPEALRDHLVVCYFIEGEGTPPDAPAYNTGYCIADVLQGRSDWSADDVGELRHFVEHEPRFPPWLQVQFDDIDTAIRDNPIWGSELLKVRDSGNPIDVNVIKRAVIQKSAADPDAMRQLRNGKKLESAAQAANKAQSQEDEPEQTPEEAEEQHHRTLRRRLGLPEEPTESDPDPWRPLPPLTPELRRVILGLASQPDIHSVSCPFPDYDLWYALIEEQIKRSKAKSLPFQEAFCLCAPNSGIDGMQEWDAENECSPFVAPPNGGYVHISYEGVCGGDLFIVPAWRKVWPGNGAKPETISELVGKECNYVLTHRDLGIVDCATRTIVADGWYLYKSNAPHEDCNPFHRD